MSPKCGYCKKEGHCITSCDNVEGMQLKVDTAHFARNLLTNRYCNLGTTVDTISRIVIRLNSMSRSQLLLINNDTFGNSSLNKRQLAAKYLYSMTSRMYEFYSTMQRQMLPTNNTLYMRAEMFYWKDIADGASLADAKERLRVAVDDLIEPEKFNITMVVQTYNNKMAKHIDEIKDNMIECAICMEDKHRV